VGVNDPAPANISGEKRVTHSVEHRINWGYVAVAVAVLVVVAVVGSRRSGREPEESADPAL